VGRASSTTKNVQKQFLYTDATGMLDLFSLISNATQLGVTAADFGGSVGYPGVIAITEVAEGYTVGQICGMSLLGPYVLTPLPPDH
jgi:hypothetical protein